MRNFTHFHVFNPPHRLLITGLTGGFSPFAHWLSVWCMTVGALQVSVAVPKLDNGFQFEIAIFHRAILSAPPTRLVHLVNPERYPPPPTLITGVHVDGRWSQLGVLPSRGAIFDPDHALERRAP